VLLTLQRFASLPESTISALSIDGAFECFGLEDQAQPIKVQNETRIPEGTYQVVLQTAGTLHTKYASKFSDHVGMLALGQVPGFTGVMIHVGNTDRDSAGCILVGDVALSAGEIGDSVKAYRRVYRKIIAALLSGEPVSIEVK
jgi:hypothetical protein